VHPAKVLFLALLALEGVVLALLAWVVATGR
jgi:hypothetical protein